MEAELERYLQTNITLPYFIDEYRFPNLTEKEIAANNKQKKVMLKALEKFDKKVYTHLVSGSFDYQGKLTSVQSFLIQKTEVSNLEYRTFLYDLLIQGRKDDFLIAKPEQKNWSQISGLENTAFEESYFTHEAFNNYPVVNISREGAELFCNWLSQEVDKILDDKKKELFNDIRLPMREEWVMAASIEGKKGPYCWDGEKTTNSSGCYLANYKPLEGSDSASYKADGGFYTVRVDSYFPNDFGLYNMNGNVAEMVYNDINTKAAGTAGGSWRNSEEEIKILGPDPYPGVTTANPSIGFRVVMTVK
jgi:formylglycine-generating enzyme required for sulfatase activity